MKKKEIKMTKPVMIGLILFAIFIGLFCIRLAKKHTEMNNMDTVVTIAAVSVPESSPSYDDITDGVQWSKPESSASSTPKIKRTRHKQFSHKTVGKLCSISIVGADTLILAQSIDAGTTTRHYTQKNKSASWLPGQRLFGAYRENIVLPVKVVDYTCCKQPCSLKVEWSGDKQWKHIYRGLSFKGGSTLDKRVTSCCMKK